MLYSLLVDNAILHLSSHSISTVRSVPQIIMYITYTNIKTSDNLKIRTDALSLCHKIESDN